MAYKVFISHSTADLGLVYQLKYWLEANGIEAHVAVPYGQPGGTNTPDVRKTIAEADCVLALLALDGIRSESVNDEVRFAAMSHRLVVPIVEVGVELKGFLADQDHIPFDRLHPEEGINHAIWYLYNQRLSKESQEKARGTVLLALGLLALAAVAASRRD